MSVDVEDFSPLWEVPFLWQVGALRLCIRMLVEQEFEHSASRIPPWLLLQVHV